jgi:hypothetical protein
MILKKRNTCAILLAIFLLSTVNAFAAVLDIYPAPPGLKTSPDLKLAADDRDVWVERIGSPLQTFGYSLYGSREQEDMDAARFSCDGPVRITIRATVPVSKFVIRPLSRNIKATVSGNELTFSITGPQKLYIEINDLPHLAVFADPPEKGPHKKGDPGVIYYAPGVHNPGKIHLVSNMTMYIAAGAVVYTELSGRNLENVTIEGRGIIQGTMDITGCRNFNVDGVFIRNTKGWTNTLTDCHNSSFRNVKVFSYEAIYSVDGINPVSCTNFTIDDCFMRCRDDCVAVKSIDNKLHVDSVYVTNCVMVGWACSDGVTLGYELNGGPVRNVFVKNCDILYARGGGRTDGHSAFSIVCDGPATISDIYFEDIRVEENVEFKNLELIVTDGTLYGTDAPGHIRGVHMKNVTWANGTKPFILSGFSAGNKVEDVTFDSCYAGGRLLKKAEDADFRMNRFTGNISF